MRQPFVEVNAGEQAPHYHGNDPGQHEGNQQRHDERHDSRHRCASSVRNFVVD